MTRVENNDIREDMTLEELLDMAEGHIRAIRWNTDGSVSAIANKPELWFTAPTTKEAVEKLVVQVKVRGV